MAMDLKKAISEGRVTLTDLRTRTLNGPDPGSPLKMTRMIGRLEQDIAALEAITRQSLFAKIKDTMIDDASDRAKEAAYRSALDLTYQLGLCYRCQCSDCAAMVPHCRCQACLFGSRVVECSKDPEAGLEVRVFEPGIASIRGEPVLRTEFDRKNLVSAVTVRQTNGLERRFLHPLEGAPATDVKHESDRND